MLYLAEVKKQKSGFMGKTATELNLLACQRNDQTWNAVPGDESVPGDAANDFENGALILVNLNNNRQVQGTPEPAGTQIVRDLSRLSKLQDKIKNQEEEIEMWKQSLTAQAQALQEREAELEAEFAQLEQEGGAEGTASNEEVEEAKAEANRIREEFERKSQELEQAWEHLRGEQRRLEERQQESGGSQNGGIEPEQMSEIQSLVEHLTQGGMPTQELQAQVSSTLEQLENQQANYQHYWQQLEEQRADAQNQQTEVDRKSDELEEKRQGLQSLRGTLEEARQEYYRQKHSLEHKQIFLEKLKEHHQSHELLQESLSRVASGAPEPKDTLDIDVDALEGLSQGQLQEAVNQKQAELDKLMQFVGSQEEELTLQREAVEELEAQLKQASGDEVKRIEEELADEKEQKKMLHETLVGQQRTLAKRQTELKLHLRVLQRKQGVPESEVEDELGGWSDLTPILTDLGAQSNQLQKEMQTLEGEIQSLETTVQEMEADLREKSDRCDTEQSEVRSLEESLREEQASTALLWGRVNWSEEVLPSLQEGIEETKEKLNAIAQLLTQVQDLEQNQQSTLGTLKNTLNDLVASH
ncbi:pilus motility taxis protein HmpF [Spirulina sp. CS-785/01]|uniref:pilus motility taxis protein HmpF n=1 Tax=Spirulina sp. CS-785/01 TaxID=3021716 RepID=UPI00232CD9AF|nr:pilus motility taxis protein HmpF [Spirulina sp. CS-785/01]MDB9314076.1 pilus motility taxis protein HmpF [Spirulina sp. CS-785/01]